MSEFEYWDYADVTHRNAWEVPECPDCETDLFVEKSNVPAHDWVCHSCGDFSL